MNENNRNKKKADSLFVFANAYLERKEGSRLQNINDAIDAYQEAAKFFLLSEYPYEWGVLQADLGLAYYMRSGLVREKNQNLLQAIDHLHRSQLVVTKENYPFEWADTLGILAGAYGYLTGINRSENIEKAIQLYEQSLDYFAEDVEKNQLEWAQANNSLGNVYIDRVEGTLKENINRAIYYFNESLRVIKHDAIPEHWAMVQVNLGRANAIAFLETRDDVSYQLAVECFENGLRIRTAELMPFAYRRTAAFLADLCFANHQWETAFSWYKNAIQVGERLLSYSFSNENREVEISLTSVNYANAAYCLLQMGRFDDAVLILEQGKTQLLARALELSDDTLNHFGEDERKTLQELRDKVKSLEVDLELESTRPHHRGVRFNRNESEAQLRRANSELERAFAKLSSEQNTVVPSNLTLSNILNLIPEDGALIPVFSTRQGTAAIVIPHGTKCIERHHIVFIDDFNYDDLYKLLWGDPQSQHKGWINTYREVESGKNSYETWRSTITSTTGLLWSRLLLPVHKRLAEYNIKRVVLMPQGGLQLLPLHAAWREVAVDGGKKRVYFSDNYEVTYVSSAYILQVTKQRSGERTGDKALIVGIENAYNDLTPLHHSLDEVRAIASLFKTKPIIDFAATASKIREAARDANYIHLSCHGSFAWEKGPLDSAIYLAHDKAVPLSKIISDFKLEKTRLVTLSACETGICDVSRSPDEYVGLPAGFLQAGAAGIVSSLWMVDDQSTKFLMGKFYENHITLKMPPAEALNEAQRWLRNADEDQLGPQYASGPRMGEQEYDEAVASVFEMNKKHPYANPYFWAAFTFTGA